ncbi:MAG: hypothetical protein ACKOOL_12940 [Novosphingobium sp.]
MSLHAAQYLWDKTAFYIGPSLTPHPDDHLGDDLKIDDDDWSMDWPAEWARMQGIKPRDLPDWPSDWPPTIRNYGKWLSIGSLQAR